jgi:NAD(P)H-dependent FMN reductase
MKLLALAASLRAEFSEFTMPIFDGDAQAASGLALKARIEAADGMTIASPEYNYSVGGPLKNATVWIPLPFGGKAFTPADHRGFPRGGDGTRRARLSGATRGAGRRAPS